MIWHLTNVDLGGRGLNCLLFHSRHRIVFLVKNICSHVPIFYRRWRRGLRNALTASSSAQCWKLSIFSGKCSVVVAAAVRQLCCSAAVLFQATAAAYNLLSVSEIFLWKVHFFLFLLFGGCRRVRSAPYALMKETNVKQQAVDGDDNDDDDDDDVTMLLRSSS